MQRHLVECALALVAVGALTGCSVEPGGVVGLTRDANGEVQAVVAVCDGYIDGLTVWQGNGAHEQDLGSWRRRPAIRNQAELSLQDPGTAWTTERSLASLPEGTDLHVFGWTEKNRWTAPGPSFTTDDLVRLRPAEVWFERYDEDAEAFVATFLSRADFRREACKDL